MNEAPDWKTPKWPFVVLYIMLLGVAGLVTLRAAHPLSELSAGLVVGAVVIGSVLFCLPFLWDYRAAGKMLEINAFSSVADQLADLKQYSEQISAATSQWALVQETTKGNTDKTVTAAREVAERMTAEIREFNEFQVKLNDTEKAALRLEVEKLRRAEAEWLQVVVRLLDHGFAFHLAVDRSGNAELAEQVGHFQNAGREAARRVGLAPFVAAAGEKFDAQKHRAHGVEKPAEDAVIAETLAPGMTLQGRLLRPVLVRLQEPQPAVTEPAPEAASETPAEPAAAAQPEKTAPAGPGELQL